MADSPVEMEAKDLPAIPPPPPRPTISPKRSTFSSWTDSVKSSISSISTTLAAPKADQRPKESTSSLETDCFKAACIIRAMTLDMAHQEDDQGSLAEEGVLIIKHQDGLKIPIETIAHCQGLVVFTITQSAGFVLSGSEGSGVVVARLPDGSWSEPCGILLQASTFGFISGHAVFDIVLILRTSQAVQSFKSSRITLGGDIPISPGPVGDEVDLAEITADAAPIWSYIKTKGEQSSLKLDGNVLLERVEDNERAYGSGLTAGDILEGRVGQGFTKYSGPLLQTILAAEGKEHESSLIPYGLPPSSIVNPPRSRSSSTLSPLRSPSLLPFRSPTLPATELPSISQPRRLPVEELDEDDLAARREMEEVLRQFGIQDPTINISSRLEDPNLLQGSELETITTPPLSGASSPGLSSRTSGSSVVYPLSLEEDPESPALALGIKLSGDEAVVPSSSSIHNIHEEKAEEVEEEGKEIVEEPTADESILNNNSILSDDVEQPPTESTDLEPEEEEEEEERVRKSSSETARKLSLEKPPVPPRRSPKVVQEGFKKPETPVVEAEELSEEGEKKEEENVEEETATVKEEEDEPHTPTPQTPTLGATADEPLTPSDSGDRSETEESFQEAESGEEEEHHDA